ncbi:DUF4013 domain-containing protein [Bergeyella sp. RCAD1439]|uniref:DUF4013 domain-containing protein n=1 Tax=Bergeyella anatis TaxID=3113737 RepID=UPI002E197DEF|nr:DUF4013 domain-containing protein [Bergeyella sp. RCAD1439]
MEFYKHRDFGALVGDTFAFFKENGKNYFKNYFLINGLLLIAMVALFAVGYGEFFAQIFEGNVAGQNYYFESYFQENQWMLILVTGLLFLLFLALMLVNYSYPVFYMKRLSETGNKVITADQILGDLKRNFGRLLVMFLGLCFVVFPIMMIVFGIAYLLIFIIIGLFLLLLLLPLMLNTTNFIIFDYLHTKRGFFASLSYAVKAQYSYRDVRRKGPFWKYVGSSLSLYMIIQVITSVFTTIPIFLLLGGNVLFPNSTSSFEGDESMLMVILLVVIYGVGILVSFILSNLIYVNAGLMYYDSREDLHRTKQIDEIETIGNAF